MPPLPAFPRPVLQTQEAYKATKQTARLAAAAWAGSQTCSQGDGGELRAVTSLCPVRPREGEEGACFLLPQPQRCEVPQSWTRSPGCLLHPGFTLRRVNHFGGMSGYCVEGVARREKNVPQPCIQCSLPSAKTGPPCTGAKSQVRHFRVF